MFATVLRYGMGSWRWASDELDAHALRLGFPPPAQQRQHDVLAADPGPQPSGKDHAPALRRVK